MRTYFSLFLFLLFSVVANGECLKFGVIPYGEVSSVKKEYEQLATWMKKSDICMDIVVQKSYSETIQSISESKVDCSRLGPFSYVLAKKSVDVVPLVVGEKSNGKSSYRAYLTTSSENAKLLKIDQPLSGLSGMSEIFQKMQQLQKSFTLGFTDEGSTSGYAIPSYYLKLSGFDLDRDFKRILFLGTHDSSALAVKNGIVDLSFSNDKSYNKLLKRAEISKESNRIIWHSDDIPESPIVCRRDIGEKKIALIRSALQKTPYEYVPKHGSVVKFIRSDAERYKIIEDIADFLER